MQHSDPELRHVSRPGGVALAIWDYGGKGAPLLLAHCNGGCARLWDPLVPQLARQFHVYALDHRGHGASDTPAGPADCTWALQGADVLATLDALGISGQTYAAGHSSGAAYLLEAETQRPGAFAGLVLFDPVVGSRFCADVAFSMARQARRRQEHFADRASARAHLAGKPPMNAWDPRVLDAFVAHGLCDTAESGVRLCCPREVEAWIYEGGGSAALEEALPGVACLSLVVGGGEAFVAEAAQAAAARMPRAQYCAIPGSSHFLPQEAPERAADLILSFFDKP